MNFTFYQKEAVENDLNINEALVFSILKYFKNVLSFNELVHYLPIVKNYFIYNSLIVLQKKDLIVSSVVENINYYQIK